MSVPIFQRIPPPLPTLRDRKFVFHICASASVLQSLSPSCFSFILFSFYIILEFSSVQLLSGVRLFATPWIASTPGLPVHQQLPEMAHTRVHWVSDVTQPSRPLSSPSPPALNLSQRQGLFKWVSPSHQVAKVLEFQLQHQSFQWTPRTDLL